MGEECQFDSQELVEYLDGDVELAVEMVDLFFIDAVPALTGAQAAFAAGDYELLYEHAHALKGAAANIRAKAFSAYAQRLATAAQGRSQECGTLLAGAQGTFAAAERALREWQKSVVGG